MAATSSATLMARQNPSSSGVSGSSPASDGVCRMMSSEIHFHMAGGIIP